MSTTFTKSGTVPQEGASRLKYIQKVTEAVLANHACMQVDVFHKGGDKLLRCHAWTCDWDWSKYDYLVVLPEPPKIQLRLPMYIKYKTKTVSVVTSLNARHQHITVDGGEWRIQDICNDVEYSNDGTNWQPFTGQEVI